jgi:hypothetical protein
LNPTDTPSAPASEPPKRSKARARTIWGSLGGIALVGGSASYLSTLVVIQAARGHTVMTFLEAALADPTIAAASVNIVDAHRRGGKIPKLSIASIVVAAVVTLGANYFVTDPHAVPKWLVNVWPPVAFLLAFESLMSYLRRGGEGAAAQVQATGTHDEPCPHGVAVDVEEAVLLAFEHERDCLGAKPTFVEMQTRFGLDRKRVAELVRPPAPAVPVAAMNGTAP